MRVIFASQYGMPCVVADDDATAEQVMDECGAAEAIRWEDGTEYCVQLRPEVGPELWTERALRGSLPVHEEGQ